MRWVVKTVSEDKVSVLANSLGINKVLSRLLLHQGYDDVEAAKVFLNPRLSSLADPENITNVREAALRLKDAVVLGHKVVVIGDYDVDGVTSTVFLVDVLRKLSLNCDFIIPKRLEDGYGLTQAVIDKVLSEEKPNLLVALDCGTNSHVEIEKLVQDGIDVIVIDHHKKKTLESLSAILVNPHATDTGVPAEKHFCTVGLVFKVVHALLKTLRSKNSDNGSSIELKDYLDLVALGTVADMVPLLDENRVLTRYGIRSMAEAPRKGLLALMHAAGLEVGRPLSPYDLSFKLGPRINASGRLADAALPVKMLLSENYEESFQCANELNSINRERQAIENAITEKACDQVSSEYGERAGVVLFDPDWHPGVVGIVAGRLSRQFHRPCIVLGSEGSMAKGSGRSISGVDLVAVLKECDHLMKIWGGHSMAVGVTLGEKEVREFQRVFDQKVLEHVNGKLPEQTLEVASWIELEEISEKLLEEIDLMQPFGQGNPSPVFGLSGFVLSSRPQVFGNNKEHIRFRCMLPNGGSVGVIGWKLAERCPPLGKPIDLAFKLAWNYWGGSKKMQMELIDWKLR